MIIPWKEIIPAIAVTASLASSPTHAEEKQPDSAFSISGYAEAYFSYDSNEPSGGTKSPFIYSYNKNSEISMNLAFVKGAYNTNQVRANLAIAGGSYMNANYASEPGVLNNLYEGNIGLKLSNEHNLWLDAGVFASHIGFETATGKDNWTLTRSMAADNSPYYETGGKISYTSDNDVWFLSALVLNGWQHIQRVEGNSSPSFGTQVMYKPSAKITLNSSLFIGNDKPDPVRKNRFFHDFYVIYQVSNDISAMIGLDIGAEQKFTHSSSLSPWFNSTVILKYTPTAKSAIAIRAEYFEDKDGVIITTGTPNGFRTWGFSTNYDYHITGNMLWRLEARMLNSKDNIFTQNTHHMVNHDAFVTTALAVSF